MIECSNYDAGLINEFCSTILTVPYLLKFITENSSLSLNQNQHQTELDLKFIEINQFKSKIVENALSSKIYSVLADSGKIKSFLTEKNDVNEMICFLGF